MGFGPPSGWASFGKARLLTGQGDALWIPDRVTRKHPILYFPSGPGVSDDGVNTITEPGMHAFLTALRDGGAVVVICDWDGDLGDYGHAWGNSVVRGDAETVRTSLVALLTAKGCPDLDLLDVTQIVLSGASQGAFDAFGYAINQPTKVKAIGTWAAATDLQGFYTGTYRWGGNSGTALRNSIAGAYGITYPTALPAWADPYDNAASVTCPVLMAYSTADLTTTEAAHLAMEAALPDGEALIVSRSAPHSDLIAAAATSGGLARWLLDQAT